MENRADLDYFRKNLSSITDEEEESFVISVNQMTNILKELQGVHLKVNEKFQQFNLPPIEDSYYDLSNVKNIFRLKERGIEMNWECGYAIFALEN